MFPLYGTPMYFDEYLKNLTLTNAIERNALQKTKLWGWMASCNNKNPVSVNIDFNHQIFGDRLKVKKKS